MKLSEFDLQLRIDYLCHELRQKEMELERIKMHLKILYEEQDKQLEREVGESD